VYYVYEAMLPVLALELSNIFKNLVLKRSELCLICAELYRTYTKTYVTLSQINTRIGVGVFRFVTIET